MEVNSRVVRRSEGTSQVQKKYIVRRNNPACNVQKIQLWPIFSLVATSVVSCTLSLSAQSLSFCASIDGQPNLLAMIVSACFQGHDEQLLF